jgi:hypothetical protein
MKLSNKVVKLLNTLNKISTNYSVHPKEIVYEYHSKGLRDCLDEAGIDYEIMNEGICIPLD